MRYEKETSVEALTTTQLDVLEGMRSIYRPSVDCVRPFSLVYERLICY